MRKRIDSLREVALGFLGQADLTPFKEHLDELAPVDLHFSVLPSQPRLTRPPGPAPSAPEDKTGQALAPALLRIRMPGIPVDVPAEQTSVQRFHATRLFGAGFDWRYHSAKSCQTNAAVQVKWKFADVA